MKKAQVGDLTVSFNAKYNYEIGELRSSFNTMVKEINNLMNLVQIEENSKSIAEMNVLQAQIKPHFMYNALDTIVCLKLIPKNKKRQSLIFRFCRFTNFGEYNKYYY